MPPPPRVDRPEHESDDWLEPEPDTPATAAMPADAPEAPEAPNITVFDAPPTTSAPRLEISRTLLATLVGALMISLVTIGFLVGRGTGAAVDPAPDATLGIEPASAEAESPRYAPFPAPRAAAAPAPPTAAGATTTPPRATPAAPRRPVRPPPTAAASEAPASADAATRDALSRYFLAIDTMGGGGGMSDPEQMATAIVTEGASGNWSSFDEIARTQQTNLSRMRQMSVPPQARDYHETTLRLMQAGVQLMEKVRRGMQSADAMALTALSTDAQAMQLEAEQADRLAADLKTRYGLTR